MLSVTPQQINDFKYNIIFCYKTKGAILHRLSKTTQMSVVLK